MKDYFDTEIRPLSKELGCKLGLTINIEYQPNEQSVPVTISYISHTGNRVTRLAGRGRMLRALGLMI